MRYMLGQWRKCKFCGKKFRLIGTKGLIRTQYNYITLVNKYSGQYEYSHKQCFEIFRKTKPREFESEIRAGFDLKRGIFVEGGLREESN